MDSMFGGNEQEKHTKCFSDLDPFVKSPNEKMEVGIMEYLRFFFPSHTTSIGAFSLQERERKKLCG